MSHALILFALTLTGADGPPKTIPAPAPVAPSPAAVSKATCPETWKMTLRDAIRIGLDSSEAVRLIGYTGMPAGQVTPYGIGLGGVSGPGYAKWSTGDPAQNQLVIAPLRYEGGAGAWQFKAEVMAEVRSIEQQYWSLAQQIAQRDASEKAVRLTEEILKREQDDLEHNLVGDHGGGFTDLAEAQQRLEQFRLDLVTKTSDVITAERQLRHLLGLPPADDRRIVTVSAPTEAKVDPDWKPCLAEMLEKQPDVARQKAAVALVEKKLADDEATLALCTRMGVANLAPTPTQVGQARKVVEREREFLNQIIHQTTHSLARFFLEIDANFKQLTTAKHVRAAAAQRLDAQRAAYEEGRITIDRYLDAVSQYASAVAQEALFKSSYNISIVAFEEAKGTLLGYDKIVVADPPRPKAVKVAATDLPRPQPEPTRDDSTKVASFGIPPTNTPEPARTGAAGKTVSFQFTVGAAARPIEVRGSFTVSPAVAPSGVSAPPSR